MTTTQTPFRPILRFAGHYLEMCAAMIVGMVALSPLWPADWMAAATCTRSRWPRT